MRGDISQLVKIITTMKVASCSGMPYAPALCFARKRTHPHFLERERETETQRGMNTVASDRARMRTRGARLKATKHAKSLGVCLPPAAWQLPRLCPTPTDSVVGGARQPLWKGLAFAL